MTTSPRAPGFYWVRCKPEGGEWEIGHWTIDKTWWLTGNDCGSFDEDMLEINERGIER